MDIFIITVKMMFVSAIQKPHPPLVGSCTQNIIPDLINFTAKAW